MTKSDSQTDLFLHVYAGISYSIMYMYLELYIGPLCLQTSHHTVC